MRGNVYEKMQEKIEKGSVEVQHPETTASEPSKVSTTATKKTKPIKKWRVHSWLLSCRTEPYITQQQLADKVGVTRKTIYEVEKGISVPSLGLALAIAEALKVPVDELFKLKLCECQMNERCR